MQQDDVQSSCCLPRCVKAYRELSSTCASIMRRTSVIPCRVPPSKQLQAIEASWSGDMLKAVVCGAIKQVKHVATRRGPPSIAASHRSLSTATAHDHPEKSDESWRMCHRIVDCGTDWSRILNLTYQAPLDGSNTAITVMRLAKVSRGKEHLVAKDPRFQHLIQRIQGGTELSDLSPAQLSGIKEGLNKMGVNVDVGSKNG